MIDKKRKQDRFYVKHLCPGEKPFTAHIGVHVLHHSNSRSVAIVLQINLRDLLNMPITNIRSLTHKKDPFIDETRIALVEHYKTSDVSGSEWRYRYHIQLFRKGTLIASSDALSMNMATIRVAAAVQTNFDDLAMNKDWRTIQRSEIPGEGICCQPGCPDKSTRHYVFKNLYDSQCIFKKTNEPNEFNGCLYGHEFCDRHGQRGDQQPDDSNDNYVCIQGKDWNDVLAEPSERS